MEIKKNNGAWISLIALALVVGGCNSPEATTSSTSVAQTPAQPTTAAAKRQDLIGYRFFDGTMVIPPSAQATAYSPYDTPVVSVSTSSGKYVERGEPIVKLEIPGADQATNQAKTNSAVANSTLSEQKSIESGPVKAAKQALKDAKDAEKAAQDTVASGGSADVTAATQTRIEAENALRDAQQKMQENLAPAKQFAVASSAQLQAAKADAAQGIVRAPIAGTVVTLTAKPGMDAKSKQELATIIDYSEARIQATVPPDLKDLVTRDSKVIIAMSGPSSEPLEGRVLSVKVSPPTVGQKSSGYLAIVRFTKPRSITQPASGVRRVGIKTGEAKNALVIPASAVVVQEGKSTVKVQKGSDWESKTVETGLTDGNMIEIKSGLSEGDVVQVASTP